MVNLGRWTQGLLRTMAPSTQAGNYTTSSWTKPCGYVQWPFLQAEVLVQLPEAEG